MIILFLIFFGGKVKLIFTLKVLLFTETKRRLDPSLDYWYIISYYSVVPKLLQV